MLNHSVVEALIEMDFIDGEWFHKEKGPNCQVGRLSRNIRQTRSDVVWLKQQGPKAIFIWLPWR
jgi:hypothetical protein